MKSHLLILACFLCSFVNAQENAKDYILPTVNNQKTLYLSTVKSLNGDLADIQTSFSSINYTYFGIYNADGTVSYKVVHFDESLFGAEDHAYFLNFSGNSATLSGYSRYEIESDIFYDEVVDETYQNQTNQSFYKVPNESYQTLDWIFKDPHTSLMVDASSYYKTMTIYGYEKRVLVVEFRSGGGVKKEYYLKNYGLVAVQLPDLSLYINDFSPFKLFSKSELDASNEKDSRSMGWKIINRLRDIKEDSMIAGSSTYKLYSRTLDSLTGLYEHLMLRNPELQNPYKYIISIFMYSASLKVFNRSEKKEILNIEYNTLIKPISNYFFIRPYADAISKDGLSTYVSDIDKYFYTEFWKMDYLVMKLIFSNNDFRSSYKVFLYQPRVDEILKYGDKIDNYNKCILYSYVAVYYFYKEDVEKRYFYLVKYVENFKYLSQADKDLNIEYMRNVMINLSTLNPGKEETLIDAVKAVLELKDYGNAIKIANNGYVKGIGSSLVFGLNFAEAAYKDDVNKEYLRKAMKLLESKYTEMNVEQINQYLVYCRSMSPEFDCRKAEAEVDKAKKREKAQKEKKEKEDKKQYRGGSRALNLAVAANPFAGLNTSGSDAFLKFLPMSAELRTGKIVHEFRVNTFFDLNAKNRFVLGKTITDETDKNSGWKHIKGNDYSYGFYIMKNDISSYKKTCSSVGGGVQFLYGMFTTSPETINITQNNISKAILVNPNITRYEALINFKTNLYNWKSHLFITMFYGAGAGMRSIDYNPQTGINESDLKDETMTVFEDRRYIQKNWQGAYFTFRLGFRFGFTLF